MTEITNRFIPKLFKNDPILLVVCGFERHNLHQAERWEKIIFLSLIVLMFFMTNAFESKIVSLMVNKPSIQPIKSLEDFDKYGIKIYVDLQQTPEAVNHSIIGKYAVHGVRQHWETLPDVAMYVSQEVADMSPRFSFNFERGEPWFDVLEDSFLNEIPLYRMAARSPLLELFRFTHLAFIEAGLMELHKWRFYLQQYAIVWGRRPRKGKENEIYLKFGDMLLAWIVLGFGFGVSFSAFVGELASSKLHPQMGSAF